MLIIWILYFIFGCWGNLALNQAYVRVFGFVFFFFLGTAVKYLDIGNVILAALIFRVDCKNINFCEISKIKIILITLFTDLKDEVITSLLRGKLLHKITNLE